MDSPQTSWRNVVAVLLTVSVTLVPAGIFAATSQPCEASADAALSSLKAIGVHATRGTVKSIDATTLVIARSGNRGDMTFILAPSTRREGTIVVGSTVSVRYTEKDRSHIATAVAVQRPRN
jgi:hypothetical protein